MAANTIFIPENPFGPGDVWEFDGELSSSITLSATLRQRAVELTGLKVTDAVFADAPVLSLTGVTTATPHRVTTSNPGGPFYGPTRLQSEYLRLLDIFYRLGSGIIVSPDWSNLVDYAITSVQGGRSGPGAKHDFTMSFTKTVYVALGLVPVLMDAQSQGLGYSGHVDKGAA